MIKKVVFFGWLGTIILLFLYSFTQIDLGLTLTRVSWWQTMQKSFQQIGYFQRPLSASLYLLILVLLFVFYFLILKLVGEKRFSSKDIRILLGITVGILLFSYPAFSYDIYNYIFDAKTIIVYGKSPYQFKPLDFPNDPMLGFMHWTHRPSIFPPFWIAISLIPFIFAFGKLILQILLLKALILLFYLGIAWLLYKILLKMKTEKPLLNLSFYLFNPLVIIESLVSSHNDQAMAFFTLLAFYCLWEEKWIKGFFSWVFSLGLKYSSLILLPLVLIRQRKQFLAPAAAALMFLGVVLVTHFYLGFQPWYLLWVFPFLALIPLRTPWHNLLIFLSLGALLRYAPFLYLGNWNPPVPRINFQFIIFSFTLGLLTSLLVIIKNNGKQKQV